jgi:hypothetical protein
MKHTFFQLILLFFLIGCNSSNSVESSNFLKLEAPLGDEIYFGAFPDFGGTEDIVTAQRIEDFEILIEKKPLWAYFSQSWYNGMAYPKKAIEIIDDEGIIPFVRLMPRSTEEQFVKEPKFTMSNIINGQFDKELRQWAKDAKAHDIPLLVDFAVEPNGDWFSWSGIFNGKDTKDSYGDINYYDGAERYRDAYRHIIDIFREEKVYNITWFFHADIYSNPDAEWNQAKLYYPGDNYIDWIGVSLYGPQHPRENYWDSFSQILEERYKTILEISTKKPIALLEFGVTDNHPMGSKSEWLKDAFETILSGKYINFKAISYWHETWDVEGVDASIRIDSSEESLEIFKEYVKNKRFIFNKSH